MTDEKKYKVLIVDDDEFLLNMYSVKFAKSGLDVQTATSAEAGIRKLKEGLKPDALIVDLVMPGMDGFELLKAVREQKLAQDAALIVLTNQGQAADIDRAREFGVVGYIVKASTIPSEVLTEVLRFLKAAEK